MSDVLFKITCVTCTARLSVRNESVIGQILACPKCGSMVQVTPPAEQAAEPPSDTAEISQVETAEAVSSESVPPDFSCDKVVTATAVTASEEAPQDAAESPTSESPAVEGAGHFRLLTWAAAGVVALAAGIGTFLYATSGDSSDEVASVDPSASVEKETTAQAIAVEEVRPTREPSIDSTEASPLDEEITSEVEEMISSRHDETPSSDVPPEVPSPLENTQEESLPENDIPVEEPAASEASAEPKRTLLIDPLDLDPEGLDLSTFANPSSPETVSVASEDPTVEVAQAIELPDQPEALPRVQLDDSQQLPRIDTNEVLGARIPSFEVKAIPLCEFLDFVTRMSALPVSAEPEQLRLAGVSSTKAVSVSVEETTVEGILTEAFKPLRLTPVVANDQVVLGRVGLDNLRKIDYPVGDLLDSSTTAKSLANRMREFVAPESWNTGSENSIDPDTPHIKVEGDKLMVTHQERRQYEILRLLETLRLARGMKPRSKYPIELLQANSPYIELADRLSAPATFTFSKFTPAQEIIRHWQNELGLALLVDWPALAKLDLHPQSRLRCNSSDQPWGETLDEVLTPLGLAWRAIDERTLQITTIDASRERREIAFYPLVQSRQDRFVAVKQLLERLDAANESPNSTKLFHDRSSNTMLVLANPAVQRKLAAWLIDQGWSKNTSTQR